MSKQMAVTREPPVQGTLPPLCSSIFYELCMSDMCDVSL